MPEVLLVPVTGTLRADVKVEVSDHNRITVTPECALFIAKIFAHDGGWMIGEEGAMMKRIGVVKPAGGILEMWLGVSNPFHCEDAFLTTLDAAGERVPNSKDVKAYDAAHLLSCYGDEYLLDHAYDYSAMDDAHYVGKLLEILVTGDAPWGSLQATPIPIYGTVEPLDRKGSYQTLIGFGLVLGDESIIYITADGYSGVRPMESIPMIVPKGVVERPMYMN